MPVDKRRRRRGKKAGASIRVECYLEQVRRIGAIGEEAGAKVRKRGLSPSSHPLNAGI